MLQLLQVARGCGGAKGFAKCLGARQHHTSTSAIHLRHLPFAEQLASSQEAKRWTPPIYSLLLQSKPDDLESGNNDSISENETGIADSKVIEKTQVHEENEAV